MNYHLKHEKGHLNTWQYTCLKQRQRKENAMIFRKTACITAIGIILLLGTTTSTEATCQEGVLHRLVRTVFQVPMAVLKSFEGPTCAATDPNYSAQVRYPDLRSVYGPEYRLNSQEVYEPLPAPPKYVTYRVIPPPKSQTKPEPRTNLHVYSSIPFSDR